MNLEHSENIIINKVNGLPTLHSNYEQLQLEVERQKHEANIRSIDEVVHENLPTSVLTNIDPQVFKDDNLKVSYQSIYVLYMYMIHVMISLINCDTLCFHRQL